MNMYEMIKVRECEGSDRIEALEVVFDKELVDAFLAINIKNRPIVSRNVEYFERKISEDAWARGAFLVTVNRSMTWMLDAQHHMVALKNKGYPTVRGVVRIVPDEIDEETFAALDCGSPRGLATMLGVAGITNYTHVSSAIVDYNRIGVGFTQKMTPDEAVDLINELKPLIGLLPLTRHFITNDGTSKRVPSFMHGVFLRILSHDSGMKDFVTSFYDEMLTGNFSTGSVLHGPRAIREAVISCGFKHKGNAQRILLLKAFDAYVNGRDLSSMWKRIENSDGVFLGKKYLGIKIDVLSDKKHKHASKSNKDAK